MALNHSDGKRPYRKNRGDGEQTGRTVCEGRKQPAGARRENGKRPFGRDAYGEAQDGERRFNGHSAAARFSEERKDKPFGERRERPEPSPAQLSGESDEQPFLLLGRNAVREAIKAGRSIDRILVTSEPDGSLREIVNLARDRKILVRETDRKKLDELCMPFGHGTKTGNHQGIVAYAAGVEYCTVEDILAEAKARGEQPFVIVLDGIEDPHNLGSILRSADCAGAHGVVLPKRRSASVTAAAVKASAGASEYMKIARVVNLRSALETLKKAGVWIAGADMNGQPMQKQNLKGPLALVIGSEGDGIGKLIRETCDFLVSIPMKGHIDSLNAGVAAAVLMFEKRRQDEA